MKLANVVFSSYFLLFFYVLTSTQYKRQVVILCGPFSTDIFRFPSFNCFFFQGKLLLFFVDVCVFHFKSLKNNYYVHIILGHFLHSVKKSLFSWIFLAFFSLLFLSFVSLLADTKWHKTHGVHDAQ